MNVFQKQIEQLKKYNDKLNITFLNVLGQTKTASQKQFSLLISQIIYSPFQTFPSFPYK